MNLQQSIYDSLQAHCGDERVVYLDDLMDVGCGYRHYLRLQGATPSRKEEAPKLLLHEVGAEAKATITRYLSRCFKKDFREGYFLLEGAVTVRIDGFIKAALVDIAVVSTTRFDASKPPRTSVLLAATKAALVGAPEVLLLVVDRDKQEWAFWTLTGDFKKATEAVRHDISYITALTRGDAIPLGMASERTCKKCPVRGACTLTPTDDPPPYEITGITTKPAADTRMTVEGFLWSLNTSVNSRQTEVIHPSEISTSDCDRVIAYGLLGEKEKESIDPKLRRIFDFGHAFHNVLQDVVKWALPGFKSEVPVKDASLRIAGHCDGVIGDAGLEIKSIGSSGFEKLTGPKSEHKKQAVVYGTLLDLKTLHYVYANKETGALGVYPTEIDRNIWHKVATRARNIINIVEAGELPERTTQESMCARCKFAWTCRPDTQWAARGAVNSTSLRRL